jgi:hypothetical protein
MARANRRPMHYQPKNRWCLLNSSRIEYNRIYHVRTNTAEGANICTLANRPGTVTRGNHIHDCNNPTSKRS